MKISFYYNFISIYSWVYERDKEILISFFFTALKLKKAFSREIQNKIFNKQRFFSLILSQNNEDVIRKVLM